MQRASRPGGTLVINSFGDLRPGETYYTGSLYKTLTAVFKSVRVHAAKDEGNIYFVASDQPELAFLHEPELGGVHPAVSDAVTTGMRRVVQVDCGRAAC